MWGGEERVKEKGQSERKKRERKMKNEQSASNEGLDRKQAGSLSVVPMKMMKMMKSKKSLGEHVDFERCGNEIERKECVGRRRRRQLRRRKKGDEKKARVIEIEQVEGQVATS